MKRLLVILMSIVMVASFCFSYVPQTNASDAQNIDLKARKHDFKQVPVKTNPKPSSGFKIADDYTNLSASIPDMADVESVAWNGSYWLIGGTNPSGDTARLYSYDGKTFTDLSTNITGMNYVTSIGWNGSYWLIGGDSTSTLYSYNGTTFTNLTSDILGMNSVTSVVWNGSYWLIGGYTDAPHTVYLYSYDGSTFTDLSSNLSGGIQEVDSLFWNGSEWLIGGGNYAWTTAHLYSYDGTNFTNLSASVSSMSYVASIAWNGSRWLIGGTDTGWTAVKLYSYNDSTFMDLSSNVSDMGIVDSIASQNISRWLIGGTDTGWTAVKLYSYNGSTFSDLSSNLDMPEVFPMAWNGSYWLIGGIKYEGEYTVSCLYKMTPLVITAIFTSSAVNDSPVTVTITGTAFDNVNPGVIVKLIKQGQADIIATNVTVVSSTEITCTLPISGADLGAWNVVVTNPDSQVDILPGGFTITEAQKPAELPYTGK